MRRAAPALLSAAALAALALATGCAARLEAPGRAVLRVGGEAVPIVAPAGLCIDPTSPDVTRAGGFLLIGDCRALGLSEASARAFPGLLLVGLTEQRTEGGLPALQAFLSGPGKATLGRSGNASEIRLLSSRIVGDVLYIHVEDRAADPAFQAEPRFWRAFTKLGDRLLFVTALPLAKGALPDTRARALLAETIRQTRAASSPAASPPATFSPATFSRAASSPATSSPAASSTASATATSPSP